MSRKSRKTNTDVQKTFMKPITVDNRIMGRTAENDYFSFLR